MPSASVEAGAAVEAGSVILGGRRYRVERDFGRLPPDVAPARVSQVAVDSTGCVHVLRRGAPPIVVFTPDGGFAYAYGAGAIFDSHGLAIDGRDRVWIADRDAHQILAFTLRGDLLQRLGERHQPNWVLPFNHPTRAAVAADGEIYVADGYGNARVQRFSPVGEFLGGFGELGHGRGAFMTPHSILIDRDNRVLVVDRENDRVQIFDRVGGWVDEWRGLCRPMDLCQRADGVILVTDQVPSVTAFAADGRRIDRGRPSLNGAHGIAEGPNGDLFLAEIEPSSVTRLTPVA